MEMPRYTLDDFFKMLNEAVNMDVSKKKRLKKCRQIKREMQHELSMRRCED